MFIDIEDIEAELQDLENQIDNVRQLAIQVGLDYTNKIGGQFSVNTNLFYNIRNSFIHRLASIHFHVVQLLNLEKDIPQILDDYNHNTGGNSLILGQDLGNTLAYFFEDLVFNLCSLLDYLGNIIGFAVNQPKINDWEGILKACSPKNNNAISKLKVAPIITDFNNNLTSKLYKYRSEVIHEKAHYVGVETKHTIRSSPDISTHSIKVHSPIGFDKKFTDLKAQIKLGNSHSLRYTTFWIVKNCCIRINEILQELKQDIESNRKIPIGQEPFTIKDQEDN